MVIRVRWNAWLYISTSPTTFPPPLRPSSSLCTVAFHASFLGRRAPTEDGEPIPLFATVGGPQRSTHISQLEVKKDAPAGSQSHRLSGGLDRLGELTISPSPFCTSSHYFPCTGAPRSSYSDEARAPRRGAEPHCHRTVDALPGSFIF
jgi:hypothetical protein